MTSKYLTEVVVSSKNNPYSVNAEQDSLKAKWNTLCVPLHASLTLLKFVLQYHRNELFTQGQQEEGKGRG